MNSLTKLELNRTFTADVSILSPVSSVQFVSVVKIAILGREWVSAKTCVLSTAVLIYCRCLKMSALAIIYGPGATYHGGNSFKEPYQLIQFSTRCVSKVNSTHLAGFFYYIIHTSRSPHRQAVSLICPLWYLQYIAHGSLHKLHSHGISSYKFKYRRQALTHG